MFFAIAAIYITPKQPFGAAKLQNFHLISASRPPLRVIIRQILPKKAPKSLKINLVLNLLPFRLLKLTVIDVDAESVLAEIAFNLLKN